MNRYAVWTDINNSKFKLLSSIRTEDCYRYARRSATGGNL